MLFIKDSKSLAVRLSLFGYRHGNVLVRRTDICRYSRLGKLSS